MAPKKMRKPTQETMVEEPTPEQEILIKFIWEEDLEAQEDHGDPKNEEEQPNIVLFTLEQLEVLFKMNRPDFIELVAALKGGSSKNAGFQPAKPRNFDGVRDQKVVDVWLAKMEDYLHAVKVEQHWAVELAQSYLKGYVSTWWRTLRQEEGKNHGYI
jgi:hypothetical protein